MSFFSELIICTLIISACVQIFFYIYFYSSQLNAKTTSSTQKGVSVVICARNEAENLKKNLPLILKQSYKNFEVILINHASTDNSLEILEEISRKNKRLKVYNFPEKQKGKKEALTFGINKTKNEYLLLSDADCKPLSNSWIQNMVRHLEKNEVVLGYGAYIAENKFINEIICYETIFIANQYMTFAKKGNPYMGVGRNIAYRKELFYKVGGFKEHEKIKSGDDDLFIKSLAPDTPIAIECTKESFTCSPAKKNMKEWISQKKRHISTAPLYKPKIKVLLATEILSRTIFILTTFFLIFEILINSLQILHYIAISLVLLRNLTMQLILSRRMLLFNEKRLIKKIVLYDFMLPILYFIISINNRKEEEWK